jgi:hypothetical protein
VFASSDGKIALSTPADITAAITQVTAPGFGGTAINTLAANPDGALDYYLAGKGDYIPVVAAGAGGKVSVSFGHDYDIASQFVVQDLSPPAPGLRAYVKAT